MYHKFYSWADEERYRRLLNRSILLLAAGLLIYSIAAYACGFRIISAEHRFQENGKAAVMPTVVAATLPFSKTIPNKPHTASFRVNLKPGWLTPSHVSIMSEGCLIAMTVNGSAIDVPAVGPKQYCRYNRSKLVPVGGHMQSGINQVEVTIRHTGTDLQKSSATRLQLAMGNVWPGGLRVEVPLGLGLGFLFFLLLLRLPPGRAMFDPLTTMLLTVAAIFYGYYLVHYSFLSLSTDIYGHRNYFKILYENFSLPDSLGGKQNYQPPLYYLLGLPFYVLGALVGAADPTETVRTFSLGCFLVFLGYGIATIRLLVRWKPAVYMATALLVLWPAGMIYATRVNNDLLIYPLFAAGIYSIIRWQQEGDVNHLWKSCAIALLSIAAKTSGVLLCMAVALTVVCHMRRAHIPLARILPPRRTAGILLALAVLCMSINFGRTMVMSQSHPGADRNFLVANQTDRAVNRHWRAMTEPARLTDNVLLGFRPYELVMHPFIQKKPGDTFFWNKIIANFLFSEKVVSYLPLVSLMTGLYLLMLLYTLGSGVWMLAALRAQPWVWAGPVAVTALSLAGLIYMWLLVPYGAYVRYVYYCLPWLLALFASNIEWHRNEGRAVLCKAGLGIGAALVALFFVRALQLTYL